ncbi:VWA domain-containing protein [Gordonia sp. (in: high G+C Gram-positive bacteria)]|uniref:vWA domain-containing protein n=1 Tax=Gordonia sp. (in: high G+C Gram-positive bacteria) TaxID=84139 RepID=UPI00169CE069|nr:VWA domain-containing protein [Gordonia sp. (in: high G+C Gram-positive bacteria)]NLG47906.1 VWA domain-containing protein [Gordonia sp. (in: high G+C Gram-positive bacteria)]
MRSRRSSLRSAALAFLISTILLIVGCSATDGTAIKAGRTPGEVVPQKIPTLVVLDASDSMNTADAPGPRIDAAKRAVTNLADGLPHGTDFGVVVFGSQMPAKTTRQSRACTDVSTPVPLGPLNTAAVSSQLATIRAQGFTPIGNALEMAANQLPPSGPASIVLVSDGEPTCAPDPCVTAKAIHANRPDVTVSAVGFRTDNADLKCVAADGGGLFVTADNAEQLSARLSAAQNSRDAATRLSTDSRGGIAIGDTLDDVRSANPSFPRNGRKDGDRTIYLWEDCTYEFDDSGKLVEIAPGDPPGSAGTTIDGVTKGTAGSRAIELYGDAWQDSDGVAIFPADEKAGTAYLLGYEGGSSIAEGTVTTVVLCGCLPKKKTTSGTSGGGPEIVKVIAVDKKGSLRDGYTIVNDGSSRSFPSSEMTYCSPGLGAITPGVFRCGTTADSAVVCWNKTSTSQLLCAYSPWEKTLRAWTYSVPPEQKPVKPQDEVVPWALELADGSRCNLRFGGAWDPPPTGYRDIYNCSDGPTKFVVVKDDSEAPAGLFDKSGTAWTVLGRDSNRNGSPSPVPVTKVYYSAAEQ